MLGKIKYYLLLLLFPVSVYAQTERETKVGASLSAEIEKALKYNLSAVFEEEVRLVNNNIGFDRNVSSLGLDYSLFDKRVKIGAYYAFIYLYNNDHLWEPRNRFFLNLSYKETFHSFTLSWRGRLQSTYRDEDHGSYKVNPRYVMKNKFEVEYLIFGSPWKPYLACDISTNLNDPITRYDINRLRFQGGTSWRVNKTTYWNFFLRWDEYLKEADPRVISLGVSYKLKY